MMDHDHVLVPVIEVLRPVLGMDDGSGEFVNTGKLRHVPLVLVVVARADDQEGRDERALLATASVFRLHEPPGLFGVPVGRLDFLAKLYPVADTEFVDRFVEIAQDLFAAGENFRSEPRLEVVGVRKHVGVGSYARIPEQVPGATDAAATLEYADPTAGKAPRQPAGYADAGDACANDQDVVFVRGQVRIRASVFNCVS
jgi:hypothetical protein